VSKKEGKKKSKNQQYSIFLTCLFLSFPPSNFPLFSRENFEVGGL
jgi:hypothetical protein